MAKRRPQSNANDTPSTRTAPAPKAPRAAASRRSLVTATQPSEMATAPQPTEDDIRHRAYLRYLERGGGGGDAFDDWLYAERELKKS